MRGLKISYYIFFIIIILICPVSANDSFILFNDSSIEINGPNSVLSVVSVTNLSDTSKLYFSFEYDPTILTISTMRPNTSIIGDLEIISDPDPTNYGTSLTKINNGVGGKGELFVNLKSDSGFTITDETPILDFVIIPTNKSGNSDLTFGSNLLYKTETGSDYVRFNSYIDSSVISAGAGIYPFTNGTISAPSRTICPGVEILDSFEISDVEDIQKVYLDYRWLAGTSGLLDLDLDQINATIPDLYWTEHGGSSGGSYSGIYIQIVKDSDFSAIESTPILDIKILNRPWKISGSNTIDLVDCYFTKRTADGVFVSYPFAQSINGVIVINSDDTDSHIILPTASISDNTSQVISVYAENLADTSKLYFSFEYDPTILTISTMRANTSVIGDLEIMSDPDPTDYTTGLTNINNGVGGKGELFVNLKSDAGFTITDETPILDFVIIPTNKSGNSDLTFGRDLLYKTKTGDDYVPFSSSADGSVTSIGAGPSPLAGATLIAPSVTVNPGIEKLDFFKISDVDDIQEIYLKFGWYVGVHNSEELVNIDVSQVNTTIAGLYSTHSGGSQNGTYKTKNFYILKDSDFSVTDPTPILDVNFLTNIGKTSGSQAIDLIDCYFTKYNADGICITYPFANSINGNITISPSVPSQEDDGAGNSSSSSSTSGSSGGLSNGVQPQQPRSSSTSTTVNVGGDSAVKQVYVVGTDIKGIVVTAEKKVTPSSDIPEIDNPVYQYIEITPARFSSISSATIDFSVPRSWIEQQNVEIEEIKLSRYHDGVWTTLPTNFAYEKNGLLFFEAQSPGFSTFAIIIETVSPSSTEVKSEDSGTLSQSDSSTSKETIIPTPEAINSDLSENSGIFAYASIIGVVIISAFIISLYFLKRWWIRRQNPALFQKYD